MAVRKKNITLVEFVRAKGGIKPTYKFGGKKFRGKRASYDFGDLERLTYKQSGKRGLVSDKGKLSLDGMHQAALEAGYDVGGMWDLIDKMEDEIRGGKTTYATRGYIDYRDNPKMKVNGIIHAPAKSGKFSFYVGVRDKGSNFDTHGIFVKADSQSQAVSRAKTEYKKQFSFLSAARLSAHMRSANFTAERTKDLGYTRNPKTNGVMVGDRKNKSDLYITQLGPKSYGVFLKTYLLKKFTTKLGAMKHLESIRKRRKTNLTNPGQASKLAKAFVSAFDNDLDLDVDAKDIARLKKGEKSFSRGPRSRSNPAAKIVAVQNRFWLGRVLDPKAKAAYVIVSPQGVEIARLKSLAAGRAALARHAAKKNPDALGMFANAAVGVASALQIKEMLNRPKRTKRRKTSGTTTAKRKPARKNPHGGVPSGVRYNEKLFDRDLAAIEEGNYRAVRSANAHGRLAGYSKREVDWMVKRAKLASRLRSKLNPAAIKKEMRIALKNPKSTRKPTPRPSGRSRIVKKAVTRSAKPKSKIRNPKSVRPPRSRTFESFNGRPVTNATPRPVSRHAPARLAQLGDLIEIKLVGGRTLKPNPSRYKLTAANGRLWIAGGKFAKANPKAAANEINPLGEIDHVVYRTHKPHHGDAPGTHYIHKLGEETGHRPLLCVDREGFPVIRGGKYKIEARGIVN